MCVCIFGFWYSIASKHTEGGWVVNEDIQATVRNNAVFKQIKDDLMKRDPSKHGTYLVVNSLDSRLLYETQDSTLWDRLSIHSFVGRIEFEDTSEEVLVLGKIGKLEGFDNIGARYVWFM